MGIHPFLEQVRHYLRACNMAWHDAALDVEDCSWSDPCFVADYPHLRRSNKESLVPVFCTPPLIRFNSLRWFCSSNSMRSQKVGELVGPRNNQLFASSGCVSLFTSRYRSYWCVLRSKVSEWISACLSTTHSKHLKPPCQCQWRFGRLVMICSRTRGIGKPDTTGR